MRQHLARAVYGNDCGDRKGTGKCLYATMNENSNNPHVTIYGS
jgi:hypothetical protein